MVEKYPDVLMLLNAGDIPGKGYAENHMKTFFSGADAMLSCMMFVNATGNHDRDEYLALRFQQPSEVLFHVYSIDIGNIHFVAEYDDGEELDQQAQ